MKRIPVLTTLTALAALWTMAAWSIPSIALGAVPPLINFQGKVTDSSGNPVADGSHSFSFRLFDNIFSVTPLWSEGPLTVTTTGGLFNHWLGTGTSLPQALFTDYPELYLEIEVDGEVQTPRVLLTSTPYAQAAGRVNTVDGATGGSIDGSLSFDNVSTPMLYVYESGTGNPSRPVVSHSPAFSNWGLVYHDAGDKFDFQGAGTSNLLIDLSSSGSPLVGVGTASPNSRLHVNGPIATAVATNAPCTDITLNESHSVVLCCAFDGDVTVHLPTAVGITGRQYAIKVISSPSGFDAIIDPFGSENIDFSSTYALTSAGKYATIVSDGTRWWIIANN